MVLKIKNPRLFPEITRLLNKNKVVILPCDTIYGLCGKAPSASRQIAEIKGRQPDKPFLMLIHSVSQIKEFSDFTIPSQILKFWPGTLTLIIPGRDGQSYGFRMPDHDFLRKLLTQVDFPLYSTSVNKEGEAPLNSVSEIISQFEDEVSLVVDGGDLEQARASTVLDLCSKPFKILRQGDLVLKPELLE